MFLTDQQSSALKSITNVYEKRRHDIGWHKWQPHETTRPLQMHTHTYRKDAPARLWRPSREFDDNNTTTTTAHSLVGHQTTLLLITYSGWCAASRTPARISLNYRQLNSVVRRAKKRGIQRVRSSCVHLSWSIYGTWKQRCVIIVHMATDAFVPFCNDQRRDGRMRHVRRRPEYSVFRTCTQKDVLHSASVLLS